MRHRNLPVLVLQDVGECALKHAGHSAEKARRVLAQFAAAAAGFHTDQPHLPLGNELVKRADGIRSPAYAGDYSGGQPSFLLQNLLLDFLADYLLEIAHHSRVRMRTERAA